MASPFINTLTSFSGADLVCSLANKIVGEMQSISWAIQRQKAPVFTLGSADARSFSRGKRGIAGSMSMAVFDQDALIETMKESWEQIAPKQMYTAAGNVTVANSEDFSNLFDMSGWNDRAEDNMGADYGFSGDTAISAPTASASDGSGDQVYTPVGFTTLQKDNINYADTLPPFDTTMTFANEYGQSAFQKIYDVDLLNEGSGVSVDSIVMEKQVTFVARRMSPLIKGIYNRDKGGQLSPVQGVV